MFLKRQSLLIRELLVSFFIRLIQYSLHFPQTNHISLSTLSQPRWVPLNSSCPPFTRGHHRSALATHVAPIHNAYVMHPHELWFVNPMDPKIISCHVCSDVRHDINTTARSIKTLRPWYDVWVVATYSTDAIVSRVAPRLLLHPLQDSIQMLWRLERSNVRRHLHPITAMWWSSRIVITNNSKPKLNTLTKYK